MKVTATVLSLFLSLTLLAQSKPPAGYEIRVTVRPLKSGTLYLGHYYGRQLPIIDSARIDATGTAVFRGSKKLGGGIYLVGMPDRARHFEILVDKAQRFSVLADTADLTAVRFVGSPDNDGFKAYQRYMNSKGRSIDSLLSLRRGSAPADSLRYNAQVEALNAEVKSYRTGIITRAPNSLLAVLLKAMKDPEVPQNHPAAKTDSLFAYRYFKKHYWDEVSFMDDRLARTPFFEPRLDRYMEQLVFPAADSVIRELDWMLSYASVSEEMQRFLLLKFVNRYLNQKYMWEDAVFVHLFEKYFAQKQYAWLNDKGRKMITDRAYSLMSNIMGNPAPEVDLPDSNGKAATLYGVEAPYTLVAIWDPTCGHCKETLPKVDSLYRLRWKDQGMKIYALAKETDGTRKDWTDFITQQKLQWVHVYYTKEADRKRVENGIPSYSQLYDVQSFPTLYLLDKDKRIIAKKVTYEQVDEILQHRLKK
jgi:thiol-disulfide isomerase/thioredoxin